MAVVRTSTANLASVQTALQRLGCEVRFTDDPRAVLRARRLVLPGVGAFAAAQKAVSARGLEDALRRRIERRHPTLAVCLGMQLMAQGSEEAPGVPGLGVLNGVARCFPAGQRVPQMGWNRVTPAPDCRIVPHGFACFANSYRLGADEWMAASEATAGADDHRGGRAVGGRDRDEWLPAWSEYGGRFLAAVESGAVVGCQFHPELSGAYGRALLSRWLDE